MKISKYCASGNDFVIITAFSNKNRSLLAKKLCDRFNGVGADGLIIILPDTNNDFKWEFYNSDGSVAKMCGNGARAAFMYAYENNLISKKAKFLSGAGVIDGEICSFKNKNAEVKIKLTKHKVCLPKFNELDLEWCFYDTGVPHLVSFVSDVSKFNLDICKVMRKKYNANVNFAQILDDKILVRTFERGVEAETLACGTGMAASFYAAFKEGKIPPQISVYPTSGERLELSLKDGEIYFKGIVKHSFDAIFYE